jgi:hypothetical protein
MSEIMKKLLVLVLLTQIPTLAHAADPEAACRAKVLQVLPNVRNLVVENEVVTLMSDRPADPDSRYFLVDVDFKTAEVTRHQRYICLADGRGNAFLRGVARP